MKEKLVARAMDVVRLTEDQLRHLQGRETEHGYMIASWSIQQLFHLPTLKERYGIPDKTEAFQQQNERVWAILKENNLLRVEGNVDLIGGDLEAIHSFDWGIWRRREFLDFSYQGSYRRPGSLKDAVREFRSSRMESESDPEGELL